MKTPAPHPMVVTKIVEESPGVRTYRLELPEALSFPFVPGQFVSIAFPDDAAEMRPFSIASSPLEKGFIEITAGGPGAFGRRLLALRGGEKLLVSGPSGSWSYRDGDRHAVLVSGGTGIAPFRSMIRYVLGKGLPNRLALFYSARTPADILYRQELGEFERRGVQVHITITRPQDMERGQTWTGPTGRISLQTLRDRVGVSREATYYLCGPGPLVESLSTALSSAGTDSSRILFDRKDAR